MNDKADMNSDQLWERQLRQWNLFSPPLRPAVEDTGFLQGEITAWAAARRDGPARAFVLGVTPEVPAMDWPPGSRVYAVDRLPGMVKHVWPATAPFAAGAILADWLAAPFAPESADFITGDGSFTLIRWDEYRRTLASFARILRPDGRLVVRFFVRPAAGEPADAVFADLAAGRIGNFHIFKWRLAMALQRDCRMGVCVGDVWRAWQERDIDEEQVVAETGWSADVVHTIHSYRGSDIIYTFPNLEELRGITGEGFEELACHIPAYEMGDRCPTIVMQRRV